ncbi:MAG: BON domain-containing protein [Alphaproteobacteria bacterium]|nr:BON domain-containing protein [Alphaproteobacteria bacterium]
MSAFKILATLGLGAALLSFSAAAQTPAAAPLAGSPAQRIAMPDAATVTPNESLTLTVNKTYMIEFDTDIDDIIVGNPAIANVTARDRRRVAVMGVAAGESNIVFLDKAGHKLKVLDVSVTDGVAGMDQLRGLIKKYVPNNHVQVEAVNGRVILAGSVPSLSDSDRVMTLARQYAKDDNSVLNMMTIEGKDQVTLKVHIVEMQRSLVKQLGVNLSGQVGFGELTGSSFQNLLKASTTNTFGVAGSALGGLAATIDDVNLVGSAVQSSVAVGLAALERVGVLRTLAEPNLTAISGESAKFLAGGEFPVPVAQDQGKISIDFKPFGVGLGFTPVVLSEGRISLQVSTEVSELSAQGAFTSRSSSYTDPTTGVVTPGVSLNIPALKVRRAETTVELPSGGSLVIAGLIQQQTKQSLDAVPGIKDAPVLGALFRSRDFQNDETELVVIVTPYLVDPTDPQRLRDPDRGYVTARDARTIFFGKLNQVYAVPGSGVDKTTAPKGAAGFIID